MVPEHAKKHYRIDFKGTEHYIAELEVYKSVPDDEDSENDGPFEVEVSRLDKGDE